MTKMTYIPSDQIPSPSFHADDLGFVFKWEGHLFRGIYPSAIEQAKRYFDTGFIDEVVEKKLFPKTWISDYENEQFGLIIEHELIEPTTYASEWNFQMLKDAALMVLDIAQVGLKYGYNMIDCHKLNVMFKNNRPIYVDLGSFVLQEKGCSGWRPYNSFLRSYYYILDMWSSGSSQIAKRMMAPHVELQCNDYWLYKRPIYRCFPFLLRIHSFYSLAIQEVIVSNDRRFSGIMRFIKGFLDVIRFSGSQNLNWIRKRIVKKKKYDLKASTPVKFDWLSDFMHATPSIQTITFINVGPLDMSFLQELSMKRVLSINANEELSRQEYRNLYDNDLSCQSLCYDAIIPTYTHGKEPEKRFCSDLVVLGDLDVNDNKWSLCNALVKIKKSEPYSLSGYIALCLKDVEGLIHELPDKYTIVKQVPNRGVILKFL